MSSGNLPRPAGPKLLEQLSRAVRARRYSPRTEEAYVSWVRRFVSYNNMRHPDDLGSEEVNAFLTHLAVERHASPSTQSQARAALMFLYKEVLRRPLGQAGNDDAVLRAKHRKTVPTVMTRNEAATVLREMRGTQRLVASLLYGSGLRLSEALQLRVKDLDLDRRELTVRGAKGGRERVSVLPAALVQPLTDQITRRRALQDQDLAAGFGWAVLPGRYAIKAPRAGAEFGWQFLFPSSTLTADPRTGARGRFHLHPTSVQRAVKTAVRALGMAKRVTCHTFRHNAESRIMPRSDLRSGRRLGRGAYGLGIIRGRPGRREADRQGGIARA